ncbi:MAG: hypothetical protein AB1324_01295 [Candidatus Micrarchaeota archaeon]
MKRPDESRQEKGQVVFGAMEWHLSDSGKALRRGAMRFRHSRENFKSLVAINLVAWAAGGVFLYKNCIPAEEPLRTREIAPAEPAKAPTSTCTDHCVFELKEGSWAPQSAKTFWLAQLGMEFFDIREKLASMEREGREPLLTHEDAEIARLLSSIAKLNEKAGKEYGFEPLPVSGKSDAESFRSLNAWLGRPHDAPMDGRAISELDLLVVEAVMR